MVRYVLRRRERVRCTWMMSGFPSVVTEVLDNGWVAGCVELTVLDVAPTLQLQHHVGKS